MMTPFLIRQRSEGFGWGRTQVTAIGEREADTGIAFSIVRCKAGASETFEPGREAAILLLDGEAEFVFDGKTERRRRGSLFEEDPVAWHASRGAKLRINALTDLELAYFETDNDAAFETQLHDGKNLLESEHRDKGRWNDAAYRIVRTIFDTRNTRGANLVLGEVVNFPGRWSSYPPHHHPHPEIYHYRFSKPQGYGHSELGDDVYKVRHNDTIKILENRDHSQVAAPGYGMYYIWVIRQLPGNTYVKPEFTREHRWLKEEQS